MKKFAPVIIILALLVAAGGGWICRRINTTAALRAYLPDRPRVPGMPGALADRLDDTGEDLRQQHKIESLAELARLYHANGYFDEARRCYAGLMKLEPGNARWPHCLAVILAGDGQLAEAVPLSKKAIALDRSYLPARVKLGDALFNLNRPALAEVEYQAVLKIDPNHPYALQGLARVEMAREKWEGARVHLEASCARTDDMIGGDLLVTVYEKTGHSDLARSLRAKRKALSAFFDIPDPWVDEMFVDCYNPYRATLAAGSAERAGDTGAAMRLLEHVNQIAPDYPLSRFQMGVLLTKQHDYPSAIAALERAAQLDPRFADTWLWLIYAHRGQNDETGARSAIEKGLILCPDSSGLHLEKAKTLVVDGNLGAAEEHYRKVITFSPEQSYGYIELAKFLVQNQRFDDALVILKRGLEIEPEEPTMMSLLAFYRISTGNQMDARKWIGRLQAQPRTPPMVLAKLSELFVSQFGSNP